MKKAAEHYAARFAAKEALLKALGKGLTDGIEWTQIEIRREPSGRPTLHLAGRAELAAHALGATGFVVSLSHTDSHAIASVIAVAE
jgi:holo-[acyl-carrier protein] synthase